ncbi:unnamed protein product [Calicophoron daubneyi]|uniref:BHLH domain-containing protein n=1 Tax=Calicophoron daubneyi TaxID=300641 RepID=A0AAV2T0B0_CALDB
MFSSTPCIRKMAGRTSILSEWNMCTGNSSGGSVTPNWRYGHERLASPAYESTCSNMPIHPHLPTTIDGHSAGAKKRNKPLMEKRRRQRFNRALDELRTMLMNPATKSQSRMEKADILELTVKFVRNVIASRKPPTVTQSSDIKYNVPPNNVQMFLYGYASCESTVRQAFKDVFSEEALSELSSSVSPQFVASLLNRLSSQRDNAVSSILSPVCSCYPTPSGASSNSCTNSSSSTSSPPEISPTQFQSDLAVACLHESGEMATGSNNPVLVPDPQTHFLPNSPTASPSALAKNHSVVWRPW